MSMNPKNELHSFDEILDAKYGKEGTASREQFEKDAEEYCIGNGYLE